MVQIALHTKLFGTSTCTHTHACTHTSLSLSLLVRHPDKDQLHTGLCVWVVRVNIPAQGQKVTIK